jgi:hypothetical protein
MGDTDGTRGLDEGGGLPRLPEEKATSELILAVDPGGTTGFALNDGSETAPLVGECDFPLFVRMVESWLVSRTDAHFTVVAERYVITGQTLRKSRETTALEVIGYLRSLYYRHPQQVSELELQMPGDAKAFSTNDRLKTTGWYKPGFDHGNDAARHLMLWLVKNRRMEAPRRAQS